MPEQNCLLPPANRRLHLLVIIVVLVTSVYMLSYSARIESTDTLFLFDAVASRVRFGDFSLGTSAGVRPLAPQSLPRGVEYPLPNVGSEILQIILASPLYGLADRLPGIGLVHAVYLFNILVSAAAAGVMFLLALRLQYSEITATAAALLFAFTTILWPYSKTFFQEPLTLLLLLLAALMIEYWRASRYHAITFLLAGLLSTIGALFSKEAAFLAIPALVVLTLPGLSGRWQRRDVRRLVTTVALSTAAILLLFAISETPLDLSGRIDRLVQVLNRSRQPFFVTALHTYLLSAGASIWATSPTLLLALPGAWFLIRRGRWRYAVAAIILLLSFAIIYALLPRRGDWFGGLSWPPRFLVPVVPFVFVLAIPIIDSALHPPRRMLFSLLLFALALLGIWIQISGVSLPWEEYFRALPAESGGIASWGGGLNEVRYLRWIVIPTLWPRFAPDFAWVRTGVPGVALLFSALALVSAYFLRRCLIKTSARHTIQVGLWKWQRIRLNPAWVLASLAVLSIGLGLRSMYYDDYYLAYNKSLAQIIPIVEAKTQPGDVLLLSDLTYKDFFLNYGKLNHPRIISLPFQPGEQPSPEQPPEIVSENPDALLHQTSAPLIHALAGTRDRLWLLASGGPFLSWSVRPVERFMAAHYYPLGEIETAPNVRLIEYNTTAAPDPYAFRGPEHLTDLIYGETVYLTGYELPRGTRYHPGSILPISLYWRTTAPLSRNLTIAWFLRDMNDNPVVQGADSEPASGFAPTTTWKVGVPVWDNRAIKLPDELEPGEYPMWVVVYGRSEFAEIENLPVSGSNTREGYIGVLPTRIVIEARR